MTPAHRSAPPARPAPGRRMQATALAAALLTVAGCAPDRAAFEVPPAPDPVRAADAADPTAAAPTSPLGAAEILDRVRRANPAAAGARAAVGIAMGELAAAESALLPRVTADIAYLLADQPSAYLFKTIDAHELPAVVDFNDPGSFDNIGAGVAARWNVYDGGRTRLGIWAADEEAAAARERTRTVENALGAAALTAWIDARTAGDLAAADEASEKSVASQVEETRTKVDGGGALRSDLLSLEVRLAEARERRIRTDVARRQALASLRALLALPPGCDLPISAAPYDPGALPKGLTPSLVEAWQNRAELTAARRAVVAARIRVEAAERGQMPRVDVEARVSSEDGDATLGFGDPNWQLAVAATFDLFDGGAKNAAILRAKSALQAIEAADRRALLDVGADVESALLRLEEARARLDVASKSVSASEETLGLVETQYRGGAATVTRFLEAESARTNSRTAHVAARFAVERASVDVSRALGRLASAPSPEDVR